MEVKFNAGDMCAIPDGCKATIKDGVVIFEKEKQEFKDGDVLCSAYNGTMVIFKEIVMLHSTISIQKSRRKKLQNVWKKCCVSTTMR